MDTPELLPCPFCGGSNLTTEYPSNAAPCGVIACRTCGAEGPDAGAGEYIAAWNRRTALDALVRLEDAEAAQALLVERAADGFEHDTNLRVRICCNGQDCGCQGATADTYVAWQLRALASPSGVAALAALRADISSYQEQMKIWHDKLEASDAERDDALTRLAAAEAQVGALREALEFYADEKNYEGFSATDPCGCCSTWYEPKIHATEDNGIRARAALASAAGGAK